MVRYSATATDHFRNPRNLGRLDEADGVGTARDAENLVTIAVRVRAGRIAEARFRALACNACVAAASVATTLLPGLSLSEAAALRGEQLVAALDGLPPEKRHCAELVAEAARRAAAAAQAGRARH